VNRGNKNISEIEWDFFSLEKELDLVVNIIYWRDVLPGKRECIEKVAPRNYHNCPARI
jgi:hypothetical protein